MKQLKQRIAESGLKQIWIAHKVGVGATHLNMMLNEKATMKDSVRNNIEKLLEK